MKKHIAVLLGVSLAWLNASAADWPNWRGPSYNGSSAETNLPSQWSKTENVAWSLDLPGPSAATPVIWGDHVFLSTTHRADRNLQAWAIDRRTGKVLWQHKVADGFGRDDRSTYASGSPATDGKVVVYFYGNGPLAVFDLAGKQLWSKDLCAEYGTFAFLWTFSASPTLLDGRIYIQVLQRDVPVRGGAARETPIESYIVALDALTGKMLWRQTRPSQAVAESREAYTTPIPLVWQGRKELLIAGGDCLTGHDQDTGKELWRWGTWNPTRIGHWRLVPSPVAGGGIILACGPKRSPVYAIKAGGKGELDASAIAWSSGSRGEVTSDVPTPLFYQGDFFVLSDVRNALSRVEPQTGKVKWTVPTPGRSKYESSPTGADGKIYFMNFRGEVAVVEAETGKVLQVIPMAETGEDLIRSTVAAARGRLFIRTNAKLYCIGK